MKRLHNTITASLITALCAGHAMSLGCSRDAMLVFDASSSMSTGLANDTSRLAQARNALAQMLPDVAPLRRMGLLSFSASSRGVCEGIELHFEPKPNATQDILEAVDRLDAGGMTPLTSSIEAAAEALHAQNGSGVVVVVTDGTDTCGGNPCALAPQIAQLDPDLTVHVIGFQIVVHPFSWSGIEAFDTTQDKITCLVERTGGTYVTTNNLQELSDALQQVLGCPVIGSLDRRTS